MISDAYTREYDQREKQRKFHDSLNRVGMVAEKLGLELHAIEKAGRLTLLILYPEAMGGAKFAEFRKLETALAWAQKWTTI